MVTNALAVGAPPRTPLGSTPEDLALLSGRGGRDKERKGKGSRGGEGGERERREERRGENGRGDEVVEASHSQEVNR